MSEDNSSRPKSGLADLFRPENTLADLSIPQESYLKHVTGGDTTNNPLLNPLKYELPCLLKHLKFGRSEKDQKFLQECINKL